MQGFEDGSLTGAGWESSTVPGQGLVVPEPAGLGTPGCPLSGQCSPTLQDRCLGAGAGPALSVVAQSSGRGISFSVALK